MYFPASQTTSGLTSFTALRWALLASVVSPRFIPFISTSSIDAVGPGKMLLIRPAIWLSPTKSGPIAAGVRGVAAGERRKPEARA